MITSLIKKRCNLDKILVLGPEHNLCLYHFWVHIQRFAMNAVEPFTVLINLLQ
jgi:hypothetical protein